MFEIDGVLKLNMTVPEIQSRLVFKEIQKESFTKELNNAFLGESFTSKACEEVLRRWKKVENWRDDRTQNFSTYLTKLKVH